jgi:hypothetical protein
MPSKASTVSSRRAALRAVNIDLLQLDLKLSRIETVLRRLLEPEASSRRQQSDNPIARRVEPHRLT